jgi:predicted dehydrogenase
MSDVGFGVIGVGTWGKLHAEVYASTPGARLQALCDADESRAAAVAQECGGAVYTRYDEMLDDPMVQAVSVVLPDFLHAEACLAAIRRGKHVLVEKPLATTEEEALRIVEAARVAGVTLMVDFHNRWSPMFCALKDALDRGDLGSPRYAYYRLNDTIYVPTGMLSWAGRSTVAWFLASHCLDTLLWLFDARSAAQGGPGDLPVRLNCLTRSGVLTEERGVDTPDLYLTTIEWRSGLVTTIENCWILPEGEPSVFDLKCDLIGSKGAFRIDGSHHGAARLIGSGASHPDVLVAPRIHGRPTGFAAESIRHFAECITSGSEPMVDGLDGLAVTRLLLLMEESAKRGSAIEVGELYGT